MKKIRLNFGKLVKAYDAMRPSYPTSVIRRVRKAIGGKNPLVLDIGCGTGISTRQLASAKTTVIGCDIDELMLETARKHAARNVAYVQAPAHKLPFRDGTFDAITAFQALHWFADKKSLQELRRVLKKNGTFCVIQPKTRDQGGKNALRPIFKRHFPQRQVPQYHKKDFSILLKTEGFKNLSSFRTNKTDKYTLGDYLVLIQSLSIWNQVPDSKQNYMRTILRRHFRPMLKKGYIYARYEISVLIARK